MYPWARRLAALETVSPSGEYFNTSYRDYRDYRDSLKSFSGLAASLLNAFNVGPSDNPRRIFGEYVSGNYFAVLGVKPVRGRAFLPSESGDKPGASPVAVISYRLWQSLFQGDPGIVGRTIRVNRYELTVVGIAPEEFRGTMPGMRMEIWIPMSMAPLLNGQGDWLLEDRGARQMWVTARLKPGVTLGAGERGSGSVCAASGGGIAPDQRGLPREPDARVEGAPRDADSAACAAADSDGGLLRTIPDRGRERSQSAACPRHRAAKRAERTHGPRRGPLASGAPTSHREPVAGD